MLFFTQPIMFSAPGRGNVRFAGQPQPEKAPEKSTEPSTRPGKAAEYAPWERKSELREVYDRMQGEAPTRELSPAEQRARVEALRIQQAREDARVLKMIQPKMAETLKTLPATTLLAQTLGVETSVKELKFLQKRLNDKSLSPIYHQQILLRIEELDEALGRLQDAHQGKCSVISTLFEKDMATRLGLPEDLTAREIRGVLRRAAQKLGIEESAPDEAKRDILLIYQHQNASLLKEMLTQALPVNPRLVLLQKPFQMLTEQEKTELTLLEMQQSLESRNFKTETPEPDYERVMHPGFRDEYATGKKIEYTKVNPRQLIDALLVDFDWELEDVRKGEHRYEVEPVNDEKEGYQIVFNDSPEVLKKGFMNRNGYRDAPEDEVWQKYAYPLHKGNVMAIAPENSDWPIRWLRYEKKGGRHRIYWAQKGENGKLEHYSFQFRVVRSPLHRATPPGGKGEKMTKDEMLKALQAADPKFQALYLLERINKMLYQYAEKGMVENAKDNRYWRDKSYRKAHDELGRNNVELPGEPDT